MSLKAKKSQQHNKASGENTSRYKKFICDKAQVFILPNLYTSSPYSVQDERPKKKTTKITSREATGSQGVI